MIVSSWLSSKNGECASGAPHRNDRTTGVALNGQETVDMQDRSEALPESESRTTGVPGHVPPELVCEFDFRTGLGDRPHEVVGALHGGPRIVYSTTNHHHVAGVGSWIPTRAEDIRA